jgi:hypothetical protein
MVKYSRRHGALVDRRWFNRIFGQQNGRTDAECWALDAFITTVVSGSGFETKNWGDITAFAREFNFTPWGYLRVWWEDARRVDHGVVVENRDGKPHFAWFRNHVRVSDWEEMTR